MKRRLMTLPVLGLLLVSCVMTNQKFEADNSDISFALKNPQTRIVNIDSLKNEGMINLSSVFKRVKTIILETNKDALIGDINSVQVFGDKIYILDKENAKSIFVFNKSGKFLQRIGKVGQGPGEYIYPTDFTIDTKNKFIYVLDNSAHKVLKFDLLTCKYINDIIIPDRSTMNFHIQYVDDKLYTDAFSLVKSQESYLLQEMDISSGERRKKWLKNIDYNKNFTDLILFGNDVFYDKTQKSPKFVLSFMDTIVTVDKKGVMTYMAIKSKDIMTQKDLDEVEGTMINKIKNIRKIPKIGNIDNFLTYNDLIFFECRKQSSPRYFICNKKTKLIRYGFGLNNDLIYEKNDEPALIVERFYTSNDDGVYSVVNPYTMSNFLNFVKKGKLAKNLDKRDQLMKLGADANPIIFIYSN
jgi:hypothetical protein